MHLIEAICHVEFPNKFHWDQYVVARLYDPPQAPVGEILLSRLADGEWRSRIPCAVLADSAVTGYIASGVGLSFWNAGQNNHSAEIFNHGQLKEFHHRTLYDSMFLVNSNWEHEREVEEKACIEVHRKLREEEERKKLRQETHLGFVWYHTMEDLDCMGTVVWPDRT
jgi:hypothetical protein